MRLALLAVSASLAFGAVGATAHEARPRTPGTPYGVRSLPDRVVLTAGADPATEMAVAYRTDTAQPRAEVQLAVAVDGPTLESTARTLAGTTRPMASVNGAANYHQVRFTALTPDTVYAYRVRGTAGWTEWFQFRTATREARPFRFLYLGDTQNGIRDHASRVIRGGFAEGRIAVTLHAGDLVSQGGGLDHDDEWGEWNGTGGFNFAAVPQIPAAGNHEYLDTMVAGKKSRVLGAYWSAQFALPTNGTDPVRATTYFVDYQGVRFIILDGTAALDLGAMAAQTDWLDRTLAASKARWNIVLMHQPVYTCARPKDTEAIKLAWKPVFDRRRVDLVLQGHDHCYSRLTDPSGRAASASARASDAPQGPVYIVSVTGSKQYGLNDRARTQPDRAGEATQFFQIVDVDTNKIALRTYAATGRLYDGFDLTRQADGTNRLVEVAPLPAERFCTGTVGPDGGKCVASPR